MGFHVVVYVGYGLNIAAIYVYDIMGKYSVFHCYSHRVTHYRFCYFFKRW